MTLGDFCRISYVNMQKNHGNDLNMLKGGKK